MKKLKIIFTINDGVHEEFFVDVSKMNEKELEEEIDKNIKAITKRQDAFIKKWKNLFPIEVEDRKIYNRLDSKGYYMDGYLFMREADLKRGYFEGRLEIIK